jgi:hypothetical protein
MPVSLIILTGTRTVSMVAGVANVNVDSAAKNNEILCVIFFPSVNYYLQAFLIGPAGQFREINALGCLFAGRDVPLNAAISGRHGKRFNAGTRKIKNRNVPVFIGVGKRPRKFNDLPAAQRGLGSE